MLGTPSKLAWCAVLIAALGSGCTTAGDGASTPQGEWRAEDIAGKSVVDGVQTTLDIAEDGTVSGAGGCNRYSGTAEINGSSIAIGPVVATKMMCLPAPMDQETKLFDAMERVRSWKIENTKLLLLDGGGSTLATFSPVQSNASIVITVPSAQAIESTKASYACDDITVEVEYFNAGPVSLATLSMNGEFVVVANVLAASGAKYAGDRFIWWTKGAEASLYDLTRGENAPPLHCRVA